MFENKKLALDAPKRSLAIYSVPIKKILTIYKKTNFNITKTAEVLGLPRSQLAKRAEDDSLLAEAFKEADNILIDDAVGGLRESVKEKEPWAIKEALKLLGHRRGYVENKPTDAGGGINIGSAQILINLPANDRDKDLQYSLKDGQKIKKTAKELVE